MTLEIEWQYTSAEAGFSIPTDSYKFYSPYISSAQRLANGNTLITEGSNGRLFEVTAAHELVWEYISRTQTAAIRIWSTVLTGYPMPGCRSLRSRRRMRLSR